MNNYVAVIPYRDSELGLINGKEIICEKILEYKSLTSNAARAFENKTGIFKNPSYFDYIGSIKYGDKEIYLFIVEIDKTTGKEIDKNLNFININKCFHLTDVFLLAALSRFIFYFFKKINSICKTENKEGN